MQHAGTKQNTRGMEGLNPQSSGGRPSIPWTVSVRWKSKSIHRQVNPSSVTALLYLYKYIRF